ncbi:MAG: hypothetical protein H6618_06260 [Deltaproteobacteria bacterium]|nr:hypothetical protein [Deltaproteobacteria bacterium]
MNPEKSEELLVLYDHHCWVCRSLAMLALKKCPGKLRAKAWQDFIRNPPSQLRGSVMEEDPEELQLWTGSVLTRGVEAWELLTRYHPVLKQLNWLATRAGVRNGITPVVYKTSKTLRKLCFHCKS